MSQQEYRGTVSRRSLLAALAGSAIASPSHSAEMAPQWLDPPPRLPDVTLVDHEGRRHALLSLAVNRPLGISFFFTGCSAVCPPQTALFMNLQSILRARDSRGLLLSVSLDPLSDSPAAIRSYAARFGARLGVDAQWLMLGGDVQSLARVRAAFDAGSGRIDDHQSTLWAGSPARRRWARVAGMAEPQLLAGWMAASEA